MVNLPQYENPIKLCNILLKHFSADKSRMDVRGNPLWYVDNLRFVVLHRIYFAFTGNSLGQVIYNI